MVVKSWGLRRTGSLRRAVRVSRRAARGRRAMTDLLLLQCPRMCPQHGVEAGEAPWRSIEPIAAISNGLGERHGVLWSSVEPSKALQGHAAASTTSPAGILR